MMSGLMPSSPPSATNFGRIPSGINVKSKEACEEKPCVELQSGDGISSVSTMASLIDMEDEAQEQSRLRPALSLEMRLERRERRRQLLKEGLARAKFGSMAGFEHMASVEHRAGFCSTDCRVCRAQKRAGVISE